MPQELIVTLNKPHAGQLEVLQTKQRFNVLACGRRWGKSKLAENLLIEPALEGKPTGYFTPTYKLLEITYKEVLQKCQHIVKRKHDNQKIELITGGEIEFWSLDNPLSGRSRKYARTVCDEIAFQSGFLQRWNEAIRATLTDLKGDGWFLSSPKGKNDFHKLFLRGKHGDAGWMSWQMPTATNPYIDPLEIQDAQHDLPADAFAQEYLAQFNENVSNPFGIDFIRACTFPMSTHPPICFGVDLAKSFDYTVIIGIDRFGQVCYLDRFQADWRTTTQKVLALQNVPICIDATGVGNAIGEDVARHRPVELFTFTSRSKQELMEALAVGIQQRKISFPDGVIVDELSNFEYEYTSNGVKYSAPNGAHDDAVCALALAWRKYNNSGKGQINYSFV